MPSNQRVIKDKEQVTLVLTEGEWHIVVQKDATAFLTVQIHENQKTSLKLEVQENADLTLFYWNESSQLFIDEDICIKRNARLNVAYGELTSKEVNRKAQYSLIEEGAYVRIISGGICDDIMKQEITCTHKARHTEGWMENYAVVLEEGQYRMVANGVVQKYASGSKSRQTSRVLTFADKQQAEITPMLLIDENDVEASHATSIGQLDENQLYYLMSRGLTKNDALRLMAMGYLLPLVQITNDAELRKEMTDIIEKKVQEICLI